MSNKRLQIPNVIVDDPNLQRFLDAIRHNIEMDHGQHGVSEKRPTVEELIEAGVANADQIK